MESSENFGLKIGIYSFHNKYMKIYEYWRSRSFSDLRPGTLIVWQFLTFSKATWSFVIKFHVELPGTAGAIIYSNGLCHMTTIHINGKNL